MPTHTSNNELIRQTAAAIFTTLVAGPRRDYDPRSTAIVALQQAAAFAQAAEEFERGEIDAEVFQDDQRLDYASAPNLREDHPLNLRTRRFGNEETLARFTTLAQNGEKLKREWNRLN